MNLSCWKNFEKESDKSLQNLPLKEKNSILPKFPIHYSDRAHLHCKLKIET